MAYRPVIDPDDYYSRGAEGLAEQIRWHCSMDRAAAPDKADHPALSPQGPTQQTNTWADIDLISVTPVRDVGVFVFFRVHDEPDTVYQYFADYSTLKDVESAYTREDWALYVSDVMDDLLQFQIYDFRSEEVVHTIRQFEFARLGRAGAPPKRLRIPPSEIRDHQPP